MQGDDSVVNTSSNPDLDTLVRNASRRSFIKMGSGLAAIPFLSPLFGCSDSDSSPSPAPVVTEKMLGFTAIAASSGDSIVVPAGYKAAAIVRWGDPLSATAPDFRGDATEGSAEQELQVGDNHDGMHYFPINGSSDNGILAFNNEYINLEYFYAPGTDAANWLEPWTIDKVKKAQAAHGVTIVEVSKGASGWSYVRNSRFNRRITGNTPMTLTGPAAGNDLLKTAADATGTQVLGTLNNCANGFTPWGTYLTCEENFNGYFGSKNAQLALNELQRRYDARVGGFGYRWHDLDDRFELEKNPNEYNRHGWVVEIDPFDPASRPQKRTALGRFKHENAELVVATDGTVVVYMGDDQQNEYIYKFVSTGKYAAGAASNRTLLDSGTLWVAKFTNGAAAGDFKGEGEWVELAFGKNGLTEAAGFKNQAEVLIFARKAADVVGATKMDRPEWVAANPKKLGEVYCTLTNNSSRTDAQLNDANPRASNRWGQIIRWNEEGGNPTATKFTWDLFVVAGNPIAFPDRKDLRSGSANITAENTFNSPDGLAFDSFGRLWIQSDGSFDNTGNFQGQGNNQMLAADPVSGEIKRFLVGPAGCEITGLTFTPDRKSMFINVQHPGEMGNHPNKPKRADGTAFTDNDIARNATAFSKWPDGANAKRPRSATVVITKDDGGVIGT